MAPAEDDWDAQDMSVGKTQVIMSITAIHQVLVRNLITELNVSSSEKWPNFRVSTCSVFGQTLETTMRVCGLVLSADDGCLHHLVQA
jgi:hypothetical protein